VIPEPLPGSDTIHEILAGRDDLTECLWIKAPPVLDAASRTFCFSRNPDISFFFFNNGFSRLSDKIAIGQLLETTLRSLASWSSLSQVLPFRRRCQSCLPSSKDLRGADHADSPPLGSSRLTPRHGFRLTQIDDVISPSFKTAQGVIGRRDDDFQFYDGAIFISPRIFRMRVMTSTISPSGAPHLRLQVPHPFRIGTHHVEAPFRYNGLPDFFGEEGIKGCSNLSKALSVVNSVCCAARHRMD